MNKKILLISYRLGYNNLLYWDSILTKLKRTFPVFRVFTAFPELETKDKSLKTEKQLFGLKHYRNSGKINASLLYLPLPFFIFKIRKFKPDLIILNEFNLNSFYVLFFKFLLGNVKTLLLVESDPFLGYKNKHSKFRNLLRRYIAKKVDKILTNNQLGYKYLTEVLHLNHDKIVVAPYLVSEPPINTDGLKQYDANDEKIRFLYVGRIIEGKGLIYVLKAIAKLSASDKSKIQFDIIGEGDEMAILKKFKLEYELNCVNFLGYIDYEKLSAYYNHADCFILNTLRDYRALVGFEALAYGCAMIGSKYDGARFETIHEGENGFIIDPKNIEEIQSAMTRLINDDKIRNSFKRYSKKLSVNFTADKGLENFMSVIKST